MRGDKTPIEKMDEGIFILPSGYWDEKGTLHQEVELRSLSGREEELISNRTISYNIAELVTALLSNCVVRIGSISDVKLEIVKGLLISDRDYLLLRLRQRTFGNEIQGTLICPKCLKKFDMDFDLKDIEITRKNTLRQDFSMRLSNRAAYKDGKGVFHREIVFRLPTGADQEEIIKHIPTNQTYALTELLARCIQRIGNIEEITFNLIQSLSVLTRREIESKMKEVSPSVDVAIEFECPYCTHKFKDAFDLYTFFFNELKNNKRLLYQEVHLLALYYHWSENEILNMAIPKRKMYVGLLKQEIERSNKASEL
jgi:hypothetical protein